MDRQYREHQSKLDNMSKTIFSQQRTIEQLTNALKDKYEHGLFIFSEDCKVITAIQNGEELTNKFTSYFNVTWSAGELPMITIERSASAVAKEN